MAKYTRDINVVKAGIPVFLEYFKECSPAYSASKAGFAWDIWRNEVLKIPEVKEAYNKYCDYNRKRGVKV